MNAIHLCRGKRLDNGEWATGFYYRTANGTRIHEVQDETPFCPETNVHLVDPATVGHCTGLVAAKSYRGDTEANRLMFEGDVVNCNVLRQGGTHGNWARETNAGHGSGFYITMQIIWDEHRHRPFDSHWACAKVPGITDGQIAELEKPTGKERRKQYINYLNITPQDCEIISTIHDEGSAE